MWLFKNDSSKNTINSSEYERLVLRLTDISAEQRILKTDLEAIRTDIANLRGKFNARLKGIKEEEQKEETKKNETYNNDGYVSFG